MKLSEFAAVLLLALVPLVLVALGHVIALALKAAGG